MSKPPRLSEEARAMLAAYRDAAPGAARREANLDAVRERADTPRRAAAAGLATPIAWGLASAAAAAGLVWGLSAVRAPEPEAPPAPVEAPASAAESPAHAVAADPRSVQEVVTPSDVATPSLPTAVDKPKRAQPAPSPAASASDLREETRLLRTVRTAISTGALDDAARSLDAYTTAFPNGALREDAQAYRIIVRCGQGRDVSALRRAFEQRYPASPHVARIDAKCGGEKE